jgi:hypothetical protein
METNIINKVSEKLNEFKSEQEKFINKKFDEFSKLQDAEVKKKFEEFSFNINDRLKKCFSAIDDFKARQSYVLIDFIKILSPSKINDGQLQAITNSIMKHTSIRLNQAEIKNYVDKIYT